MVKYKLKIITYDNEPVVKAKAERIEDFEPLLKGLGKKYNGRRRR